MPWGGQRGSSKIQRGARGRRGFAHENARHRCSWDLQGLGGDRSHCCTRNVYMSDNVQEYMGL